MEKPTFTDKEVREIMIKCFVKGETWGVTYGGWFSPEQKECAERASKDCEEVYKEAINNQTIKQPNQ